MAVLYRDVVVLMVFWLSMTVPWSRADHPKGLGGSELSDILVVIISQPNKYHVIQAVILRDDIATQSANLKLPGPTVELTHERWPSAASWTILSIMKEVSEKYRRKKWVFICDEGTQVHLDRLLQVVRQYDPSEEHFIGRGLQDLEATIIHHFAFHENPSSFTYPDLAAGILFSMPLVKSLARKMFIDKRSSDFSIDAMHELALYVQDVRDGKEMVDNAAFCAGNEHEGCATSYPNHAPSCGGSIPEDDVFFAVKTCSKFHDDRIPVIKKTWGPDARHLVFYSEIADAKIPTVSTGVPNTERGHCGKTYAILKSFHEDPTLSRFTWLVITDDDTLLSVERLRSLLACYDDEDPVALGERYGYAMSEDYGYTYITGGGGMVLNRMAVHLLMESDLCVCSSNDSPDDMILGMWLKRLAIPVTHSPLFHQARPMDYSPDLLSHQRPVSFHKFWMTNPLAVYTEWFRDTRQRDEL